jgi:hypothetical protein
VNTLLYLILAATPAAAPTTSAVTPAQAPSGDALTALYILVGTAVVGQLIGLIFGIVKWLGSRTVEREDKDKESIQTRLDEHDEKFAEQDRSIAAVDKIVNSVQSEVKQVLSAVDTIKGMVQEITKAMDNRFEKQGDFYRGNLDKFIIGNDAKIQALETQMRHEMQRSIHDALQMERMKVVQEREAREAKEWEEYPRTPPRRRPRSKPRQG